MTSAEFLAARKRLGKTQKIMAELLGLSLKAVHSYEQGWRKIPAHVERQIFFLLSRLGNDEKKIKPCWEVKKCPPKRRNKCPAWEFQAGKLCWFINGTICECQAHKTWQGKMSVCRQCEVLISLIKNFEEPEPESEPEPEPEPEPTK
ncbi:helix-turn-helix domain-containing protein [Desulfobacterota bacterium M19]